MNETMVVKNIICQLDDGVLTQWSPLSHHLSFTESWDSGGVCEYDLKQRDGDSKVSDCMSYQEQEQIGLTSPKMGKETIAFSYWVSDVFNSVQYNAIFFSLNNSFQLYFTCFYLRVAAFSQLWAGLEVLCNTQDHI